MHPQLEIFLLWIVHFGARPIVLPVAAGEAPRKSGQEAVMTRRKPLASPLVSALRHGIALAVTGTILDEIKPETCFQLYDTIKVAVLNGGGY